MARYYGAIGFTSTSEEAQGVWVETITERYYFGDVKKDFSKRNNNNVINDSVSVDIQISIMGDFVAFNSISEMKYITYNGSKWNITNVEVVRPRLVISIGGISNV